MSRNFYQDGEKIFFLGWDRISQSAFLSVGYIDKAAQDFKEPLILELDFPFERGTDLDQVEELFTDIKSKLSIKGFSLPDTIYSCLATDISDNSSNVTRIHYLDKDPDVIQGDPFENGAFTS